MNSFQLSHSHQPLEVSPLQHHQPLFRVIKCTLKSILKHYHIIQPKIEQVVANLNPLVMQTYQFIRAFLLEQFLQQKPFPTVNKQFIMDVFKTLSTTKRKHRGKVVNKQTKHDLQTFHNQKFSFLSTKKINLKNQTYILEELAKEILRCLNTNLSTHFIHYLNKYINVVFKDPQLLIIKQEKDEKKRKELHNQLLVDIKGLKSALIENNIALTDAKFHHWIQGNRDFILPKNIEINVAYDLKARTEQYFSFAFYLNQQIQQLGRRPYQVIPQRHSCIPKNITINTSALVALIDDKKKQIFSYGKALMKNNCKKYQKHAWSQILKIEKRSVFEQGDYRFYNQIMTNGHSCSMLFIRKDYYNKKFGQILPQIHDEITFEKLSDLNKIQCNQYLTGNYKLVGLDPGKNKIASIVNEDGKSYEYSSRRWRHETYTKRSNQIIKKERKDNHIESLESQVSQSSSRTFDMKKYNEFIKKKTEISDQVRTFYERPLFRRLSFRRFCRTKAAEARLLNEIDQKILTKGERQKGRQLVIGYGNWSRSSQMKHFIPTPNLRFKKLISSRYKILEVDEYKTSQLYCRTLKPLENVVIKRKGYDCKIHEVLTLKEKPTSVYVNRDHNARKNMLYLLKYYLENQSRPAEFCRQNKPLKQKLILKSKSDANRPIIKIKIELKRPVNH